MTVVQSLPKKPANDAVKAALPSQTEQLEVYALYKQATGGPCTENKPVRAHATPTQPTAVLWLHGPLVYDGLLAASAGGRCSALIA